MKLRARVLTFSFCFTLMACGSGSKSLESNKQSHVQDKTETPVPFEVRSSAAKNGQLYCQQNNQKPNAACDPATVMISAVSESTITRCTGVLISEDEVLTNDHCIDTTEVVKNNLACEEGLFVHFAAPAETIPCAEIKYRSHQSGIDSIDYAIIKLSKKITNRKPVKLSSRGFNQHEPAKISRVQMIISQYGTLDGIQETETCITTYKTMFSTNIDSAHSTLMTFGGCDIEHGNSGAPIYNSQGELGGVLQGFYNLSLQDQAARLELNQYSLDSSMSKIAVGTQIACMSALMPDFAKQCNSNTRAQGLMPSSLIANQQNQIMPPLEPAPKYYNWLLMNRDKNREQSYALVPTCIPIATNSKQPTNQTLYVKSFKLGINQNFEVEWRLQSNSAIPVSFISTVVSNSEVRLSQMNYGSIVVPVCKN